VARGVASRVQAGIAAIRLVASKRRLMPGRVGVGVAPESFGGIEKEDQTGSSRREQGDISSATPATKVRRACVVVHLPNDVVLLDASVEAWLCSGGPGYRRFPQRHQEPCTGQGGRFDRGAPCVRLSEPVKPVPHCSAPLLEIDRSAPTPVGGVLEVPLHTPLRGGDLLVVFGTEREPPGGDSGGSCNQRPAQGALGV
jgi:hypothetical protein